LNNDAVTATTGMLIRRPVADVFDAFVNPELTTKFWFTRSSGRLEAGKRATSSATAFQRESRRDGGVMSRKAVEALECAPAISQKTLQ